MSRHEVTLEGVQHSPDGTVLAFRLHAWSDDDPAGCDIPGNIIPANVTPAALDRAERREAVRRRQRAVNRVLGGLFLAGVVAVPVVSQVVL